MHEEEMLPMMKFIWLMYIVRTCTYTFFLHVDNRNFRQVVYQYVPTLSKYVNETGSRQCFHIHICTIQQISHMACHTTHIFSQISFFLQQSYGTHRIKEVFVHAPLLDFYLHFSPPSSSGGNTKSEISKRMATMSHYQQ